MARKYIDFLYTYQYDDELDELMLIVSDKNGKVLGRIDALDEDASDKLMSHLAKYLEWEIDNSEPTNNLF
jgi:hypothetical protein